MPVERKASLFIVLAILANCVFLALQGRTKRECIHYAVVLGALQVRSLIVAARRDEAAVAVAQGALAELIRLRFAQWHLTAAEADVALFALKGCDIGEIAAMRGSAAGTVRAQLARVYAKASVDSQAGLIALFVEELIVPSERR